MTKEEAKEAEELKHAETALAELGIRPDGSLERFDDRTGRPDFRFKLDGRTIALEVVRALAPSIAKGDKARERLKAAVLAKLCEQGLCVQVIASLSAARAEALLATVTSRDARFVEHVATTISECARPVMGSEDLRWRRFREPPLPPVPQHFIDEGGMKALALDFLTYLMIRPNSKPSFEFSGEAFDLIVDSVQDAIDSKNDKLDAYRVVSADSCWLLVVAPDGLGGHINFSRQGKSPLEEAVFASRFDRTFLLEMFTRICVEVTCQFTLDLPSAGEVVDVQLFSRK